MQWYEGVEASDWRGAGTAGAEATAAPERDAPSDDVPQDRGALLRLFSALKEN